MVEERHRKRRLERKQHSRAQCWCVTSTSHKGKTKQDMGMGGHTRGKKDVGHTRGKGREKTRRGSPKDTHHTEKEKKAKKTMSIIRQSRALHRVHLFQPIIETCNAWNDKKREG